METKSAPRGKKVSRKIVNHLEAIVGSSVSDYGTSRTSAITDLSKSTGVSFNSLKKVLDNDRHRVFEKTYERIVKWYEEDCAGEPEPEPEPYRLKTFEDLMNLPDPSPHDLANRPWHYIDPDSGLECIDAMVAVFGQERVNDYAEIAAFKYKWRAGKKGGLDSAMLDKAKDIWYTRYSMGEDPRK